METEIEHAIVISPEVIYQQDKASTDVQISTAKQFPRNIGRAIDNAIAIATMDIETAESCNYSLPRAGKSLTGPSVHLAKIIAQVWGNLRIESKIVGIDSTTVTSQAIAWDLESNVAIKMEVKRSIMQNEWNDGKKTGKHIRMSEDMIVVVGNAANSIALRNAVFSVIPKSVTQKVYRLALQKITGDLSTEALLIAKRKQVVEALKDTYSVTEKEVLQAVGKAAINHLTSEDIVVLIGIGTAIKDGDTTIEFAFRGTNKTGAPVELSKEEIEQLFASAKIEIEAITTEDDLNIFIDEKRDLVNNQGFKTLVSEKRKSLKKSDDKTTLL